MEQQPLIQAQFQTGYTAPPPAYIVQQHQQHQQQFQQEGYNPQYQQNNNYSPYNPIPQPQHQQPSISITVPAPTFQQHPGGVITPTPQTTSAGYFQIPQGAPIPQAPQQWNRGYEEAVVAAPIEVNTNIYIQAAPQYFVTNVRQEVQQQCTLPPIYSNEHGRNKLGVSFFSIFPVLLIIICVVCAAVFEGFQFFGNRNFALYGRIVMYPILVISYLVYWITCIRSDTVKFLWTLGDPYKLAEKINNMKATAPRIFMHVHCYHYRTHVHTHRDKDGRVRHEHRRERVTTFAETREVYISNWRDLSPDLSVIDISPTKRFLKLYVDNYIVPDSEQTRSAIINTFESFKSWNRWRDRYMDFNVTYEIPGMSSCILCKTEDGKAVPPFFGLFWYFLASFCLMNYPYKMYVDRFCQSQVFPVVKHISVR